MARVIEELSSVLSVDILSSVLSVDILSSVLSVDILSSVSKETRSYKKRRNYKSFYSKSSGVLLSRQSCMLVFFLREPPLQNAKTY